jgi:hypothetical protein
MKTLKVLVLVALMALVGHAQERSDADATYALKGPVRTFRVEVATFVLKNGDYVEGPRVAQMEASFNQDGNRTDLHIYDDKGVLSRRIVMKFDGRNMTEAINYDGAAKCGCGPWTFTTTRAYLKKNRLTTATDRYVRRKPTSEMNWVRRLRSASYNAQGVLLDLFKNTFRGPLLLTTERKVYRQDGSLASAKLFRHSKETERNN